MIEIRPITAAEADRYLELLCNVFELDYARAHAIFFTEPLFDLTRKWALFDAGRIVSILTTVPLEFGWGRGIGIAGVATAVDRQHEGLASKLLTKVLDESHRGDEGAVLLFARDTRVYEKLGFEALDTVARGRIAGVPEDDVPISLSFDEVRELYESWANASQNRLRRDDLRWRYWKWNLRVCTPFHDGYLCYEGGAVREIVVSHKARSWHLPIDSEWFGLDSMAEEIGLPLRDPVFELHLMGYRVPGKPQLFMTDQF